MSDDQPFDQEAEEEVTSMMQLLDQVHADASIEIAVDFPALEKKLILKQCDIRPDLVDVATVEMSTETVIHYACGIEDTEAAIRFAMVETVERVVMAKGLQGLLS